MFSFNQNNTNVCGNFTEKSTAFKNLQQYWITPLPSSIWQTFPNFSTEGGRPWCSNAYRSKTLMETLQMFWTNLFMFNLDSNLCHIFFKLIGATKNKLIPNFYTRLRIKLREKVIRILIGPLGGVVPACIPQCVTSSWERPPKHPLLHLFLPAWKQSRIHRD